MEAMEAESEGKFTYRQIYSTSEIVNTPKSLRTATNSLVGKGPSFSRCRRCISYTVACFYVNVRLSIDPSLAKLANRIGDLRHRLAIILYDINLHLFVLARIDDLCNTWLVIEDQEWQKKIILTIYRWYNRHDHSYSTAQFFFFFFLKVGVPISM